MARQDWIVSQIGAREHYGIPRSFARLGTLGRFYTDAWRSKSLGLFRFGAQSMRALASRHHPEIPEQLVSSFNARSIFYALSNKRWQRTREYEFNEYLQRGEQFDLAVARRLERDPAIDAARGFLGFNTGSLATMKFCKHAGLTTIVDQIDPARVEEQIVREEMHRWPGWQQQAGQIPQAYWDRLSAEWAEADWVVVNSDWSRSALVEQGVPAGKIVVVPLAYDAPASLAAKPRQSSLRVLWLGSVILRKGIQYLAEAARRLARSEIEFTIAGPIGVSDQAMSSMPPNMRFLGRITRDRTASLFEKADLFVLPTLSDGFAITQLEAMGRGLPVITTPNCGAVVEDERSGLIVPARDSAALAHAIERVHNDRDLLEAMSRDAIARAHQFRLPAPAIAIEAALANWNP